MKIEIEHIASARFVCVIHCKHECYRVGPIGNHAECQIVRDNVLEMVKEDCDAAVSKAVDLIEDAEHEGMELQPVSKLWKG